MNIIRTRISLFVLPAVFGLFLFVGQVSGSELTTLGASTYFGKLRDKSSVLDASIKGVITEDDAVYILGTTSNGAISNSSIPAKHAYKGGSDIFVAKFSLDLKQLIAYTFIGGSEIDKANSFTIYNDNIYIVGYTTSNDVLTGIVPPQKLSNLNGYSDGLLTVLNKNLDIVDMMYWGGSNEDDISGLAVDSQGIYLTGETNSTNLPTKNAQYNQYLGGFRDFYLSVLNLTTKDTLYSSYIGGTNSDRFPSLYVDNNHNIYLTGETFSTDVPKSVNSSSGFTEAIVMKFAPQYNLLSSRYIGGIKGDTPKDLKIDNNGDIFLVGITQSLDFPVTPGVYQSNHGGAQPEYDQDSFIVKLTSDLSKILYATYLGGWGFDGIDSLVLSSSTVIVSGFTQSLNFPTISGAYDINMNSPIGSGKSDAFITIFSSDLTKISASTFLGGVDYEHIAKITLGKNGGLYIAGITESSDFPVTTGAFDTTYNNGIDAFISFFSDGIEPKQPIILKTNTNELKLGDNILTVIPTALNFDKVMLVENSGNQLETSAYLTTKGIEASVYSISTQGIPSGKYTAHFLLSSKIVATTEELTIVEIIPKYVIATENSTVLYGQEVKVKIYPGLYAYDKLSNGTYFIRWKNSQGKEVNPALNSQPTSGFSLFLWYNYNTFQLASGNYTIELIDASSRSMKVLANTAVFIKRPLSR